MAIESEEKTHDEYVMVPVPRSLVPAVYALLAELTGGTPQPQPVINVYVTVDGLDEVNRKLDLIMAEIDDLQTSNDELKSAIDTNIAEQAESLALQQQALDEIAELAQQIENNAGNPAIIARVAGELRGKADAVRTAAGALDESNARLNAILNPVPEPEPEEPPVDPDAPVDPDVPTE